MNILDFYRAIESLFRTTNNLTETSVFSSRHYTRTKKYNYYGRDGMLKARRVDRENWNSPRFPVIYELTFCGDMAAVFDLAKTRIGNKRDQVEDALRDRVDKFEKKVCKNDFKSRPF